MEIVYALLLGLAFSLGSVVGYSAGQSNLCEKQFQGEMHEGKCVKVQREELK